VVLLHATFDPDGVRALRDTGSTTVLLEVSRGELQRRHRRRLDEEVWSNEDWADGNLAQIAELRRLSLFDQVVDAERPPIAVRNTDAAALLRSLRPRGVARTLRCIASPEPLTDRSRIGGPEHECQRTVDYWVALSFEGQIASLSGSSAAAAR
jgi:hypothetical protein